MHDVTRHLPIKFINSSWDALAWHVHILLLYMACMFYCYEFLVLPLPESHFLTALPPGNWTLCSLVEDLEVTDNC